MRTGAVLRVTTPAGETSTVTALPEDGTGAFAASVPEGSSVELVSLRDGCGNSA